MNEVFSETSGPPDPQEICESPTAKDYLEALKPNWDYFNTANRITRIQDAFFIAQGQGMQKDEFCGLVSRILDLSFTASKLFLDSIRPIDPSLTTDAPPSANENSQLIEVLREVETPSGTIGGKKLHKAYQIAKEIGLSKRQFIFMAADALRCQELVIRMILEDRRFNKNMRTVPSAQIKVKKPAEPPKKPKENKPVQRPRTYKSRPVIPKPPKEKEDFEVLALRGDWDKLSHYERMAAVRNLINRLRAKSPMPVAISILAHKLNRSEGIITTYYHLAGVRKEIIGLMEKGQIDTQTAIQIGGILDGSKNIDSKKLFTALSGLEQMITIKVFRDVLQDCFKRKTKDWKMRVTVCRVKPDWKGEGEVLNEYQLTYIPSFLLTDDERRRFHFMPTKEHAYVTFQIGGEDRYAKVPMAALEPIGPNKPDQSTP
ncbi:hypothetical protein JW752_00835 [Candidatus Peregrinibacteria bacterium]|nr:hypothetical protein [Candidatus Peregrinibacteria bacterium]